MYKTNQKFLIFLHIQKTGGITIQRMLRQKYGPSPTKRALNVIAGKGQTLPLEESLESKQMGDRYFAGHICYGVHRLLPKPFHYITLLRKPVSRIISLHHFASTTPGAFYHDIATQTSLEEFALNVGLPELDNGQTRFLAGDTKELFINKTPIGQCDERLLETAKANIDSHFSLVGFTEQFDHSMLLLSEIMGWQNCQYLRLNSSRQKAKVSDEIKTKIAERNHLDIKLYSYAEARFAKMLDEYGITDERLERFQKTNQRLNTRYAKPYGLYHKTKSILRGQAHRP